MSSQDFGTLLQSLLSPNNEMRREAEMNFNQLKSANASSLVGALLQALYCAENDSIRTLCAVLLRRILAKEKESVWDSLDAATQGDVKVQLLKSLQNEQVASVRRNITDAIASIGAYAIAKGEWKDLLDNGFQMAQSGDAAMVQSALQIFSQLSTVLMVPGIGSNIENLHSFYIATLQRGQTIQVRVSGVEASCALIVVSNKEDFIRLRDLLPPMLGVLTDAVENGDVQNSSTILQSLIDVVTAHPSYMKADLAQFASILYGVASNQSIVSDVRHLAVEVFFVFSETLPGPLRKLPNFLQNMVVLLMNMMLAVDDSDSWSEEEDDEGGSDSDFSLAMDTFDQFALNFGGRQILPLVSSIVQQFAGNPDWRFRHAALMCIAQIAEGCVKQMKNQLNDFVSFILHHFDDPHPRVRYAAHQCIAQLSTDFSVTLQDSYHQLVLPKLIASLDEKNPRVLRHAVIALLNFTSDCRKEHVQEFVDVLLSKLMSLLQTQSHKVQEEVVSALATVADSAGDAFHRYYDSIVPVLRDILMRTATSKAHRELRGKTMEAIALIGLSVGKERFAQDAVSVMNILLETQSAELDADDPQTQYMLETFSKICQCLGQDFLPYLTMVMPPLLATAQRKVDIVIGDVYDEVSEEKGVHNLVLTIKGVGEKRISVNTTALQEKTAALSMLLSYVSELKEGFVQYLDVTAATVEPLFTFPYLEDVRLVSWQISAELVKAASAAVKNGTLAHDRPKPLFDAFLPSLLKAILFESESANVCVAGSALESMIAALGENALSSEEIEGITVSCKESLNDAQSRKKELIEAREQELDEEDMEALNDNLEGHDDLLSDIQDLCGTLMKTNNNLFRPFFERDIWPFFSSILSSPFTNSEIEVSLCMITDMIEFGGFAGSPIFHDLVSVLQHYSLQGASGQMQSSTYGLGLCAQFGGPNFADMCVSSIDTLNRARSMIEPNDEEWLPVECNIISSYHKFCTFQSGVPGIDIPTLWMEWFNALPVSGDEAEAKIVHETLVREIENGNLVLFGDNNRVENLLRSMYILARVFNTELVNPEITNRIREVLGYIQNKVPAEALQAQWGKLSPEEQNKLNSAFSE